MNFRSVDKKVLLRKSNLPSVSIFMFALVLLKLSISHATNCLSALQDWSPPAWEGSLVSTQGPYNIRMLGSGFAGGQVFLLENQSGNQKIQKVYRRHSSLENDLAAWKILKSIVGPDPRFRFPVVKIVSPLMIEMEYIPTTDLYRLLKDPNNGPQNELWRKSFNELTQTLIEKSRATGYNVVVSHFGPETFMIDITEPGKNNLDEGVKIKIKANNVAPVPGVRHQFLIFDPY